MVSGSQQATLAKMYPTGRVWRTCVPHNIGNVPYAKPRDYHRFIYPTLSAGSNTGLSGVYVFQAMVFTSALLMPSNFQPLGPWEQQFACSAPRDFYQTSPL